MVGDKPPVAEMHGGFFSLQQIIINNIEKKHNEYLS